MVSEHRQHQTLKQRQERRIRWQHGITEAQARVIAQLLYGRVGQ